MAESGTCNTIVVTTDGVAAESVMPTDGGVLLDGGTIAAPPAAPSKTATTT